MAEKHYNEQLEYTRKYLIPYFEKHIPHFKNSTVLEVGCAEGGLLTTLRQIGIIGLGVELESSRVKLALQNDADLKIITGDITSKELVSQINSKFDLIVMRDVIEHIPNREMLFDNLRKLLNPGGRVYISFPPRFSPFGGHQQNGKSFLRIIPYLQICPAFLVRIAGKIACETPLLIEHVIGNFKIGLSISKFKKLYKKAEFIPSVKELFLIRPVYQQRFGLKPRRFPDIPILREVLVSGCEMLLKTETSRS